MKNSRFPRLVVILGCLALAGPASALAAGTGGGALPTPPPLPGSGTTPPPGAVPISATGTSLPGAAPITPAQPTPAATGSSPASTVSSGPAPAAPAAQSQSPAVAVKPSVPAAKVGQALRAVKCHSRRYRAKHKRFCRSRSRSHHAAGAHSASSGWQFLTTRVSSDIDFSSNNIDYWFIYEQSGAYLYELRQCNSDSADCVGVNVFYAFADSAWFYWYTNYGWYEI